MAHSSLSLDRKTRQRIWLEKRNRKNEKRRRRVRRRGAGWRSARLQIDQNEFTRSSVHSSRNRGLSIEFPKRLDFEENYETTVSHLQLIRNAVTARRKIGHLNFDPIEYISHSAALALASEVDRWKQRSKNRVRASIETWNPDVLRLLAQMGFFSLLHLPHPPSIAPHRSTTFLPFKRGEIGTNDGGELAKRLRIEIEDIARKRIQRHFLFEGLSEAITNVGQHAYSDESHLFPKQWWLSASFDEEDALLCVTFYDQGDGIPATLPSADFFELIRDVFHGWKDSEKIEAAMEVGRSSTRKFERGKGLQNLVEFAKAHEEGKLSIYSSKGLYRMDWRTDAAGNVESRASKRDHKNSICGTLIEWQVRL